jgi:DNA-directed RNA polymerase subunit L
MFSNYESTGPALLTDSNDHIVGRFVLENTSTTVANTLRRCILTETRSVGFRADLTNAVEPGIVIRKNTSVIFNEMLAHRLTLIPLGVRRIDAFDPSRYECILRVKNDTKGPIASSSLLHVKAGDFTVREKQADGSFAEVGAAANAALFPADPITKDTPLIVTLRPQWNPEQPPEEIDLTAYPVIGTGRDFMGFCPVSQCSYENTPDTDAVRRDQFFNEWLAAFKKIADPNSVDPSVIAGHRREWETMAIQRCFKVDPVNGEANSFNFTVESVGVRPVPDIVAEGIRAVIQLVTPYTDSDDMEIRVQPTDSRMNNGIDVLFDGQEHTLGNLLQTLITEIYLDTEMPDSPITYCGYKVKHPLQRIMTLRFAIREGAVGDPAAIARKIIADAASRARTIFEGLAQGWEALVGVSATAVTVEKEDGPELDG